MFWWLSKAFKTAFAMNVGNKPEVCFIHVPRISSVSSFLLIATKTCYSHELTHFHGRIISAVSLLLRLCGCCVIQHILSYSLLVVEVFLPKLYVLVICLYRYIVFSYL